MSKLGGEISHYLRCEALRHRVALVEETGPAMIVRDASTIVSSVPYLRLNSGRGKFSGRRIRLQFRDGDRTYTIRVRTRPLPSGVSVHARVARALDERGQQHPVSAADAHTRTLHLLVEIDRAVAAEGPAERAAVAVATTLAERAIAHLMAADGNVWVGEGVPAIVGTLLARRVRARRPRFAREIAFLRRAAAGQELPAPLKRRLAMLEGASRAARSRPVPPEVAEHETRRLVRLVESRACGALRLAADEIRGLVNPRAVHSAAGHGALMFSLLPGPAPGEPRLRMWRAGEPEQGTSRSMCLGRAAGVLLQMEEALDAYGLIDTVLNFVETNSVGWLPLDAPPAGLSFASVLENLF